MEYFITHNRCPKCDTENSLKKNLIFSQCGHIYDKRAFVSCIQCGKPSLEEEGLPPTNSNNNNSTDVKNSNNNNSSVDVKTNDTKTVVKNKVEGDPEKIKCTQCDFLYKKVIESCPKCDCPNHTILLNEETTECTKCKKLYDKKDFACENCGQRNPLWTKCVKCKKKF